MKQEQQGTGTGVARWLLAGAMMGLILLASLVRADNYYCNQHWVLGAIDDKYQTLGGSSGALGCPVSNELVNPDGEGRRSHFEHGSIYWKPDTGAHEIHGAIHDAWGATGWEQGPLGYPVTDEQINPDGMGRRSHFEQGAIYWSPQTGAHAIYGAIHDLWAGMGWEQSRLGYPVTGEQPADDGIGRYNAFQNGWIYWSPEVSCSVDIADVPAWESQARDYAAEIGTDRCGSAWREILQRVVGGRYQPFSHVKVRLLPCDDDPCYPGYVSGDQVTLDSHFVQASPGDEGLLTHEFTHVAQNYDYDQTGWVTESIADWVRYALNQPPLNHGGQSTCQGGDHYTDGYECGATFLDYLDGRIAGPFIVDLNEIMHDGGDTQEVQALVISRTGQDLNSLWNQCLASRCSGGRL